MCRHNDSTSDLLPPSRLTADTIEIIYLTIIIVVGLMLNSIAFIDMLRHSRRRHKSPPTSTQLFQNSVGTGVSSLVSSTLFGGGRRQLFNTFTLFKLNLSITDFAILLVHALGKLIWLCTYRWPFGNYACKMYQFLSAFTYYSNSNVIVAIGIDRLKVVYSNRIQGSASVRRMHYMLISSHIIAFVCSIPQFVVWQTVEVYHDWYQCSTIWEINMHCDDINTTSNIQMIYEISHLSIVFLGPFIILTGAYLLIFFRLLHYTLRPIGGSSSPLVDRDQSTQFPLLKLKSRDEPPPPLDCAAGNMNNSSPISSPYQLSNINNNNVNGISTIHYRKVTTSIDEISPLTRTDMCSWRRHQLQQTYRRRSSMLTWRQQLRSRVFRKTLMIVIFHLILWLPYNLLSAVKYIDASLYTRMTDRGFRLIEDLIIINSLINPLLYGYDCR